MSTINWSFQTVVDTAQMLFTSNPILQHGQVGVEVDSLLFKIGNGTTHWNDLAYATINSQQSVWVGPSTDADNLIGRSVNDGGMVLSKLLFMAASETTDALTNAVAPVLNAKDSSDPMKAALYRLTVIVRRIVESLGSEYADLKTGSFAGTTVGARLTQLSTDLTAVSGIISDTVLANNKVWSSTKTDSEITARVATAVANLVGAAPSTLDTIYELAAAFATNQSMVTTISSDLSGTVRFAVAQGLTDAERAQARGNIFAADKDYIGTYEAVSVNRLLQEDFTTLLANTGNAPILTSLYI